MKKIPDNGVWHSRVCFNIVHLPVLVLLCLSPLSKCHMAMAQSNVSADDGVIRVNIGVILSENTFLGKMGLSCIQMALSDLYAANPSFKTRLALHVRSSSNDVVSAASAAGDLIRSTEVKAIIGPETSMETQFVIHLGGRSQIPVISYSATSPFLASISTPYFFQATQNDSSQVLAIIALMQAYGWRQVVPIYVDNDFGSGFVPYLADTLQEKDIDMPYRSTISSSANDDRIEAELYKLMTMQTRVFIVHMNLTLGSRLFLKAKQIGMMSKGYVWIITTGMTNANLISSLDPKVVESMQGALGVKTYVNVTKEYEDFVVRWKKKFSKDNPDVSNPHIEVYGIWAYDAASALARAVERVAAVGTNFTISATNDSSSSSDFSSFGVSQGGPQLREAIISTEFKGLSGEYDVAGGKLQGSRFELINIVDNEERIIGIWSKDEGVVLTNTNSTQVGHNLGNIKLPGSNTSIPKGWVISTNERRLRIGVPVKEGFTEFVKVEYDDVNNTPKVSGFCIDLFDVVMANLPYSVQYDYIPYALPNRTTAGSYNKLVDQVYLQAYDAVVGDITIIYNRSQYADFTLPYSQSGVTMVVPKTDDKDKHIWIFLKPLSWDLWIATLGFFILIAFSIWVLEHRINPQFRGPREHQAGTSLYYSFSTMVFAQSQHVFSNLARLVVVVWVFVVLILTQSYTASLTTYLTVKKLSPMDIRVEELVKTNASVGYQDGSFVKDLLIEDMGFNSDHLIPYGSVPEMHALLSNRTKGGIAAAFDEVAYASVLIDNYCKEYAMVPPTRRIGGFGFGFPKGSPLVSDVSRAILDVIEGNTMIGIEKKWFPYQGICPADSLSTSITSTTLRLESFWGLFIIAGFVSTLAILMFVMKFLCDHKDVWLQAEPNISVGTKIKELRRIFDERNLKSYTFKYYNEPQSTSNTPGSGTTDTPFSPGSSYRSCDDKSDMGGSSISSKNYAPDANVNTDQEEQEFELSAIHITNAPQLHET